MAEEKKLVYLESPYAGNVKKNVKYAQLCLRDSLIKGEAPFASHLLYTQKNVLNDDNPMERKQGINSGFAWAAKAKKTVVYTDYGISRGMQEGIKNAELEGREVEYRKLNPKLIKELEEEFK